MSKMKMKEFNLFTIIIFSVGVFILAIASCNKQVPDLLKNDYVVEHTFPDGKGRVVYIIVDGMKGSTVQDLEPPNIFALLPHSIFSFSSLTDYLIDTVVTSSSGWSNMLTGVDQRKNQVITEDFVGNNLAGYPTIINRLKINQPSLNISVMASSQTFYDNLATEADRKQLFDKDDAAAVDAAVDELKTEDPNLLILQLQGVNSAGMSSSFSDDDPVYSDAVYKADDYIGTIIHTLKARPEYENENWMVVVASNKGETTNNGSGASAFEDDTRNVFTLFYNPKFEPKVVVRPEIGDVPYVANVPGYMYLSGIYPNAVLGDGTKYNLVENGGEQTIQFFMRNKVVGSFGWPTVLSKRQVGFSGTGWNIFLKGNYWTVNTSISGEINGTVVSDNLWHVITLVLRRTSDSSIVRTYTDGKFNNQGARRSTSDKIDNTVPLRIGRIPNDGDSKPNVLISNVQIYNRALTDDEIASVSCKTEIESSHPFYENLVGYWPSDEIGTTTLHEKTGRGGIGADFTFTGNYSWESVNEYSPNLCPPISPAFYLQTINLVDIPVQIMQWLGQPANSDWNLDGRAWTPIYSTVTP